MPEDLTPPHPDAARAHVAAPEGRALERESFVQDGERVLDLVLTLPGAPAGGVGLRLVAPEAGGASQAFWAFAPATFEAAARRDLPEQDAGVEAMAGVLRALFPEGGEALARAMRTAWAQTRARLEKDLAALEKAGYSSEALRIATDYREDKLILGLPCRGLKFALHKEFAYARFMPGHSDPPFPEWRTETRFIKDRVRPRPMTAEDVDALRGLSGHEKLELLAGTVPEAAYGAFDWVRLPHGAPRLRPLRRPGGAALIEELNENTRGLGGPGSSGLMESVDGDQLRVTLHPPELQRRSTPPLYTWRVEAMIRGQKTGLELNSRACAVLERAVDKDRAFRSTELLDEAAARTLALILDLDMPVPAALLPEGRDAFDPAHPLLAHPALEGRPIPPRHQPLVGLMLGAPYAKARPKAEAAARKAAKKAAAEAAAEGLAEQLADGALLANFVKPHRPEVPGLPDMILGMVETVPGRGKGRTRKMVGLVGFDQHRTLTPRNLARMERVERRDFLALVEDDWLDPDNSFHAGRPAECRRDALEGAYRMSFLLEGGARNPILEAEPSLATLAGAPDGSCVRVTAVGDRDAGMLALAVVGPHDFFNRPERSGAAIGAVWIGETLEAWARPSVRGPDVAMPEGDRALLREALAQLADIAPPAAAAREAQLGALWDALAATWGTTWP